MEVYYITYSCNSGSDYGIHSVYLDEKKAREGLGRYLEKEYAYYATADSEFEDFWEQGLYTSYLDEWFFHDMDLVVRLSKKKVIE